MRTEQERNAYRILFLDSPLPYFSLDWENNFVFVNESWLRLFEYEESEIVGKSFNTLLPKSEDELYPDIFKAFKKSGKGEIESLLMRTSKGEPKDVKIFGQVALDRQNHFVRLNCMIQDMTEYRQMNSKLLASEQRNRELAQFLELVTDNVPDMIWAKDLNKKYIFTNKKMRSELLFAKNASEVIGKNDHFFAERERKKHIKNKNWHTFGEMSAASDEKVMQTGAVEHFEEHGFIKGTYRYLDVHKAPLFNENKEIIGTVGSARDISQQKKSEEAKQKIAEELQKSEALLNYLVRSLDDWIIALDLDLKIIGVYGKWFEKPENDKNLFIGKSSAELFTSPEAHQHTAMQKRALRGETVTFEMQRSVENSNRYFQVIISPMKNEQDEIIGVVHVSKDITTLKTAEQEMFQLSQFRQKIIDNANVWITVVDPELKVIVWNQAAAAISGYSQQQARDKTRIWSQLFPKKADRETFFGKLKLQSAVSDFSVKIKCKNGKFALISWNVSHMFDENGMGTGLLIVGRDITLENRAIDYLANSRKRLEKITQHVPAFITEVNRAGTILYVNRTFTGVSEDSVIGTSLHDWAHKESKAKLKKYLKQIFAKGETISDIIQGVDSVGRDRYYETIFTPFGMTGKVESVLMFATDITDKLAAQRAIHESETLFKTIFESARDSIFIKDKQMRYVQVNPALQKLFGKNAADLLFKSDFDLFKKETAVKIQADDKRVLNGEIIEKNSENIINDQRHYFSNIKVPFRDEKGEIIGICGIARDITDLIEREYQLSDSLKEKEILLREIHHRVKNNMQIISSLLKLQSRVLNNQSVKEIMTESQNRIRAMSLIHETLYHSGNFSSINFDSYINKLVTTLSRAYVSGNKNVDCVVNASNVILSIDDAIPLGLIVNELLSNAFKYAFHGRTKGQISIKIKHVQKSKVQLEIADNGVGLPDEFSISESKTLGLQLVSDLAVGQMNGDLTFSRGPKCKVTLIFKPAQAE